MSVSLSATNTPFLTGFLFIRSELGLEELGQRIAERLVSTSTFEGKDRFIRDEVPAVYIPNVLGCMVVLSGDSSAGYNLNIEPHRYPHDELLARGVTPNEVDLSGLLAHLLVDLEGLDIAVD
jgi:hypothetical protein